MKKLETKFPLQKIKKIIQQNEEIGKISKDVPYLFNISLEILIDNILDKTINKYKDNNFKLTPSHLKEIIKENNEFNFLLESINEVPNIEELKKKNIKKKNNKNN